MVARNLKVVRQGRSAEREALATAISDLTAAERAAMKARDAQERAGARVKAAEAKLVTAKAGIEKAKTQEAANLAQVSSVKPRAGSKIRDARNAEVDATDALEAARSAYLQCQTALTNAEQELKAEQEFVAALAGDVITAEAASRVLREAQKLQEALVNKRVELRTLLHARLVPEEAKKDADYLLMFRGFPGTYFCAESVDWDKHPMAERWQQAREALITNPDAPLPGEKSTNDQNSVAR